MKLKNGNHALYYGNVPINVKPYLTQYREGGELISHLIKFPTQGPKSVINQLHILRWELRSRKFDLIHTT